jgi:hypothetical protein
MLNYFRRPDSIILLLVILAALAAVTFMVIPAHGDNDAETTEEMIRRLDIYPRDTVKSNGPDWHGRFAQIFEANAERYGLPVKLLVSMAFFESHFRSGIKGDRGKSHGILQVSPYGRRKCQCGDMTDPEEEIRCGACWLDMGRTWCGYLKGGLTAYACGSCKTSMYRTKKKIQKRLRVAGMGE